MCWSICKDRGGALTSICARRRDRHLRLPSESVVVLSVAVVVAVAMSVVLLVLPLSPGAIEVANANGGSVPVATHDVRALLTPEPLQTRRLDMQLLRPELLRPELLRARRVQPITDALDVIAIGIALTRRSVVVGRVLAISYV